VKQVVDRRRFLKTSARLAAGIGLASLGSSRLLAAALAGGTPNAEKLGWRLACQTYTFNRFTFYETLQKVASVGLRYIEAYASQPLSTEKPESRTNASMTAEERSEVKKRLADAGIKLASYYSIRLSSDEGECRREFEFAKDMGAEMLVCDAPRRALDVVEKLAEQYRINVALHNHDLPSPYWNPDSLLKLCEERGGRIGICGDTGYWMRAEMNPVEMVRKLGGRLLSLYLKDVNKPGRIGAHDVPFGTGGGDVGGVLEEVHRQGIKPLFVIEYTYNWAESLPEVAQCVAYFEKVAVALGRA
jgi:sugar phosphate isomerase/epimerase